MFENLDLNALLVWLSGIGSVLSVSWMAERWGLFQSLKPELKRVATWASAGLISTGALWVIKNVDPTTLAAIADYAKVWVSGFVYIFLQEYFHAKNKLPEG